MSLALEPVVMSLVAGTATGLGGLIVILAGKPSDRLMSLSLGLASGVMLLVAFNDLFLEAVGLLTHLELMISFSVGALVMMMLDLAIPHIELTLRRNSGQSSRMLRTGLLIAIGIALHNFPEGFVVAAGYTHLQRLGLTIAVAIMFHNIPEGLATAIPLSTAKVKRSRILAVTCLSGLSEPLAALIGVIVLPYVEFRGALGYSLAFAAGVMTYITADELIPVACEYGHKHAVSVGLLLGIILALSIDAILS